MNGSKNKAYALTQGEFIYAVIFDEDLAHEIASEYNFDIDEFDDEIEWDKGTIN